MPYAERQACMRGCRAIQAPLYRTHSGGPHPQELPQGWATAQLAVAGAVSGRAIAPEAAVRLSLSYGAIVGVGSAQ